MTSQAALTHFTLHTRFIHVKLLIHKDTLQRHNTENSKQIFPEKELLGISPKFPNSSVCERFIYSHNRSAYSAAGKMWTDPGNI
jgi:hypothetical protein